MVRRTASSEVMTANWPVIKAVGLLVASNVFMTFAWYAHLKDMKAKPWFIAALVSWGIAFL
jgi:uncharacterized protein (DUF486 family)